MMGGGGCGGGGCWRRLQRRRSGATFPAELLRLRRLSTNLKVFESLGHARAVTQSLACPAGKSARKTRNHGRSGDDGGCAAARLRGCAAARLRGCAAARIGLSGAATAARYVRAAGPG